MIFFKPTEINDKEIRFEALDNDVLAGECHLSLKGKNALVSSVSFPSDKPFLAEGLLKAAFNFAANKNYYMGVCDSENITPLLLKLGFQKSADGYTLDIPSILMGSCCKKIKKFTLFI